MHMIPHNRLTLGPEEIEAVRRVVASGRWACGKQVAAMEAGLVRLTGRKHAVGVGSGLGALRLALLALKVGKGDEVIVPAYSCVALANAVLAVGARPVPADVIAGEWTLDPEAARRRLTRRTRAMIAVHTFGLPAHIAALKTLGVPVIEDCAHALGIRHAGRPLGAHGDIAITSFYATKLIGGGEGGAVLTDARSQADLVRQSRDYANQAPDAMRLNDKLTDLEAALVVVQLKRLKAMLAARSVLAHTYMDALSDVKLLTLPQPDADRVWYRFAIEYRKGAARFIQALHAAGVRAERPVSNWLSAPDRALYPVTARAHQTIVSLPLYPTLTAAEQTRVIRAVRE